MPLPAFLLAAPAFLLDIAPSIVGGLAGGLITGSMQKKPTTMDKVDGYVDRFHKYASALETIAKLSGSAFNYANKSGDSSHNSEKLKAEMESAQFDRDLKEIAVKKAALELARMQGDEDPGEVDAQHRAGMAGVPSRRRTTTKKPAASPPRRAAT